MTLVPCPVCGRVFENEPIDLGMCSECDAKQDEDPLPAAVPSPTPKIDEARRMKIAASGQRPRR
jgi:hypothetical protein